MTGFQEYLEEADGKNKHITHLEDVVLDDGPSGVGFAVRTLKQFGKMLDGGTVSRSLNVSVKWDGAPALVFGPDPADNRFFVATKHGAFAKQPKLAKTHSQIDQMYEGGVKAKLHLALDYLSALQPKTVIQGDVLFTSDSLGDQAIAGINYVTFQPNTILYAVDNESVLGRRISAANFGIVLHTVYTGKGRNILDYRASGMTPSVFSQLKQVKNVVALDANYDDVSGTATFTDEESEDFELSIARIESLAQAISKPTYNLIREEPLHGFLAMFINQQVRENKSGLNVDDFVLWLRDRMSNEMNARKTDAGKKGVESSFTRLIGNVRTMKGQFTSLFALHQALAKTKTVVVRKLGQASRVATFVPAGDGFRVTGPEGFVAVAHTGKTVKLVDRLEFSRINLTAVKSWR